MTPVSSSRRSSSRPNARTLVAYFTRTGNTRVIAGQIRRALGADLFEIEPAEAYPEDYEATVSQAESEREAGYEPPLKATVPNIGLYDAIFLGFPIWGMTAPSVIRSFLVQPRSCRARPSCRSSRTAVTGSNKALLSPSEHAPGARAPRRLFQAMRPGARDAGTGD